MAARRTKEVDDEIDRNLRRAFEELAAERLPERFTSLIERLKADGRQGDRREIPPEDETTR